MSPMECLQKQLDIWKSALQHSHKSYQKGSIGNETHQLHVNNLEPKILEYTVAINVLHKNGIR